MKKPNANLKQLFECTGYWWLESKPDAALAGVFRFTPDQGCTLELMGGLQHQMSEKPVEKFYGLSSQGERLTLIGCVPSNVQLYQGSFAVLHFVCAVALVGNFHPSKDLTFSKCAVRFEHIEQWVNSDYVSYQQPASVDTHSFTVKTGSRGELECDEGFKVFLRGDFTASSSDRSVHLDAFTSLIIEPADWRDLEWFDVQIKSLRDLAALSFGLPQPLHSMRFWGDSRIVAEGITETQEVTAYFWEQSPVRQSRGSYPLIMFPRLKSIRPDILNVWRATRRKYQDVIDLVLIVLAGHHTTPEVGFLLIMQAFEAFDRVANPRSLTTQEAFGKVRDAMLAAIPPGTEEVVKTRMVSSIRYANEPSLRQRLKAFYEYLVVALGEKPLGFSEKKIGMIVDTRNFHTHYPTDVKQKIFSPKMIVEETDRFCIMLIMSVLERTGIPFAETIRGVDLHERFRRFGTRHRETPPQREE